MLITIHEITWDIYGSHGLSHGPRQHKPAFISGIFQFAMLNNQMVKWMITGGAPSVKWKLPYRLELFSPK